MAASEIEVQRRQSGAVLLIVILLIGLLSAIATSFVITMRSHTKATANAVGSLRATAMADAGVRMAMIALEEGRSSNPASADVNWGYGAGFHQCGLDGGVLSIWVEDEGGKVDLNTASPNLLGALFAGLGHSAEEAADIANAIADFRDDDDESFTGNSERADYTSAGLENGPKNRQFEISEELAQVIGVKPETYARALEFVTVYSRQNGIDPNAANPVLIDLLNSGDGLEKSPENQRPERGDMPSIPTDFIALSPRKVFRVHSQALTFKGSVYVRVAVIKINDGRRATGTIKSWGTGKTREVRQASFLDNC